VPARWSMQTSVSTSSSAVAVPFRPGWDAAPNLGRGAECRFYVIFVGEEGIDGVANELRHGDTRRASSLDQASALLIGEVDLGPSSHIHQGVYTTRDGPGSRHYWRIANRVLNGVTALRHMK
jgi:hypothetical protein